MGGRYSFFIGINQNIIEIPVNPQEYTISYPTENKIYNILSIGDVVLPELPSLMEVAWDSYFPGNSQDGMLMGHTWKQPERYIKTIREAMEKKYVVDLVISRYEADGNKMFDTNVSAIIQNFEITEKGGEIGDIYYKISMKEYREFAPKIIQMGKGDNQTIVQEEKQRKTELVVCVGAKVIANGKYWYSSYGDKPYGIANNKQTTIQRILSDPSREYPILIGQLGWVKEEQLQVIA